MKNYYNYLFKDYEYFIFDYFLLNLNLISKIKDNGFKNYH